MGVDLHDKHPVTPNVTLAMQILQSHFSGGIIGFFFLFQGEKLGK